MSLFFFIFSTETLNYLALFPTVSRKRKRAFGNFHPDFPQNPLTKRGSERVVSRAPTCDFLDEDPRNTMIPILIRKQTKFPPGRILTNLRKKGDTYVVF